MNRSQYYLPYLEVSLLCTCIYAFVVMNVDMSLSIIFSQLSLNDRLTMSNHTHALHRSTLHNKFIQLIRSEFVMFHLNENTTSCING